MGIDPYLMCLNRIQTPSLWRNIGKPAGENRMNRKVRHELQNKAAKLADLIVHAKRARIHFRSEEQFLEMLGLPPASMGYRLPVRNPRPNH